MRRIKTKSGFICEVNEKLMSDWRMVKAISRAYKDTSPDEEKVMAMVDMVHILMGDEGEERLCQHLIEDGVVPSDKLMAEVGEIIAAISPKTKNS